MEKPAVRTTIDKLTFARAVIKAWPSVSNLPCTKEAVGVLWAQYWVETGGKACWGWNIGNVKAVGGQDFHYLRNVWEGTTKERAAQLIASGRATADPSADHARAVGPNRVSVLFNPPAPECKFRWFPSLDEAMREHVELLAKKKFATAWPHVVAGDVLEFARALKAKGYFTADANAYANIMRPAFSTFVGSTAFDDAMRIIVAAMCAIVAAEAPTLPELPTVEPGIQEEDGGASRRAMLYDVVAQMARDRSRT